MTAEYDIHRKSYKYSTEDWQLLVNILHEYGDKLANLSRKILMEKHRYRIELSKSRRKSIAIAIASAISTSLLLNNFFFFSTRKPFTATDATYLFCISAIIIVSALALISSITSERNQERKTDIPLNLLEQNAQVMSSRLESAIRLTITVSDQVEISLARKLEMDLRIDEAKSALEYYYSSVVGSKKAS
jgi:hypothetical protein